MKRIIFSLTALSTLWLISCNNNQPSSENEKKPMEENAGTIQEPTLIKASFSQVDPAASAFVSKLTANYLDIKNALVNGDENKAAAASHDLQKAVKDFDKSLLTAEQKEFYDGISANLTQQAGNIEKGKIDDQRPAFISLSQDMYSILKAFGAGTALYHDYCPMYKGGSMWISESKEIRNPYYGDKMMGCGSVKEVLQ